MIIENYGDIMEDRSVLILGIYLSDQINNIGHIVNRLSASCSWHVVQKWVAIGDNEQPLEVKNVTVMSLKDMMPKFVLLNKLLSQEEPDNYDFIIICDDDIFISHNFLESYLNLVIKYDFALAQPARTHNSYIDHHFVEQLDGLSARRTRFVEIGPLFSVRKDIFSAIFPFDESAYMGWGYDFVWPCIAEKMGFHMGIVDAIPVEHSLRRPVKNYNYDESNLSQERYLSRNQHIKPDEAFTVLESYA